MLFGCTYIDIFLLMLQRNLLSCQIVMFLPINVDVNQLAELSPSAQPPWSLETEENYLHGGKLKAITAYSDSTAERER
ncbi:hypothetical protein SLA2020_317860 [Shorea laevis]